VNLLISIAFKASSEVQYHTLRTQKIINAFCEKNPDFHFFMRFQTPFFLKYFPLFSGFHASQRSEIRGDICRGKIFEEECLTKFDPVFLIRDILVRIRMRIRTSDLGIWMRIRTKISSDF